MIRFRKNKDSTTLQESRTEFRWENVNNGPRIAEDEFAQGHVLPDIRMLNYLKVFTFEYNGQPVFPGLVLPDRKDMEKRRNIYDPDDKPYFMTLLSDMIKSQGKASQNFQGRAYEFLPRELEDFAKKYGSLPVEKLKGKRWLDEEGKYSTEENIKIALIVADQLAKLYDERGILVLDRYGRNIIIEDWVDDYPVVRQIDTEVVYQKAIGDRQEGWVSAGKINEMVKKNYIALIDEGFTPEALCARDILNNLWACPSIKKNEELKALIQEMGNLHDLTLNRTIEFLQDLLTQI